MRPPALAVVLAALLAGCVLAPPPAPSMPTAPTGSPSPTAPEGEKPGSCTRFSLAADPPAIAPGETVRLTATLENCSGTPLELQAASCAPRTELTLDRDGNEWRVDAVDAPAAATHAPRMCFLTLEVRPPTVVEPGGALHETLLWNGTFAYDPCVGYHPPTLASCVQVRQARAGEQRFHARLTTSERAWEAEATVVILEHEAWPAPPQPSCGLQARVEPDAIVPGEEARVLARYDHCGRQDLAFGHTMICGVANGITAMVDVAGAPRRLGLEGAVGGPGTETMCLSMVPPPRIVPPGGHLEQAFGWNGTIGTSGGCDAAGCATRYDDAPAGEHEVRVEARPHGLPAVESAARLTVRPRA